MTHAFSVGPKMSKKVSITYTKRCGKIKWNILGDSVLPNGAF